MVTGIMLTSFAQISVGVKTSSIYGHNSFKLRNGSSVDNPSGVIKSPIQNGFSIASVFNIELTKHLLLQIAPGISKKDNDPHFDFPNFSFDGHELREVKVTKIDLPINIQYRIAFCSNRLGIFTGTGFRGSKVRSGSYLQQESANGETIFKRKKLDIGDVGVFENWDAYLNLVGGFDLKINRHKVVLSYDFYTRKTETLGTKLTYKEFQLGIAYLYTIS